MNEQQYLNMQKRVYEGLASQWSLNNRDPVVGSYDAHNSWADYATYLFKDFDTTNLVALEYGCGPGRNIVKFNDRFQRIDGVDIAENNLHKAKINIENANLQPSALLLCDGKSIPAEDNSYDVVFSVICLQHIACYDIRFNIFKEILRVLKPGGHFCFQMGFGGKPDTNIVCDYYANSYDAGNTNGYFDVAVTSEDQLKKDLLENLSFKNYKSDIRLTGPGDSHYNWIWVQVQK
jgi:ubiquinone/menaquinone biosynthesis C-methylase UbiE